MVSISAEIAASPVRARISSEPLDVSGHLAFVSRPTAGAVAVFVGQVRSTDPQASGPVAALEYSAHPEAEDTLGRIVDRLVATARAQGDEPAIAVSHRVGHLLVGEPALIACVSTPHREAAFDLCRKLVEAVKAELPVWKRQIQSDGTSTWIGCA